MGWFLVLAAFILAIAYGAGVGPFEFGTVKLNLLGFSLACYFAAVLVGVGAPALRRS